MKEPVLIDSAEIFADAKVIQIIHNAQVYILRITRENKLILTK
ncbi:MAG: hemin uptake protein HemP [Sulfurimonas sp.]|jgi:hemin uptake protein HemP|nr:MULTISPECIES: hemin uptake protein HemP [unclassified Sulfurimonas]OHE07814.1 MAG: hemic transporter hemP [Sulfurimonas sp. RIFOXYB2_FULL_37_5]OHE18491.1 MAG: hemic transporter hemP [Sulfurimonas sp. RIFOXYD12_FULL_36_11]MBS4068713.1 hemin uptake protein HemP [Sulfurimonas sp.]MDD3855866.1 hemin uptake protein HemP [Sulfurimonas sp.]OHE06310.1 MAG: hemic transporter hemP [Sulfurimonas sp. RIFOXYB12_FULL_35_9]